MVAALQVGFSAVAFSAQRLEIARRRLTAAAPGFDVIDLEAHTPFGCRRAAAGAAAELVAAQRQVTQAPANAAGFVFRDFSRGPNRAFGVSAR